MLILNILIRKFLAILNMIVKWQGINVRKVLFLFLWGLTWKYNMTWMVRVNLLHFSYLLQYYGSWVTIVDKHLLSGFLSWCRVFFVIFGFANDTRVVPSWWSTSYMITIVHRYILGLNHIGIVNFPLISSFLCE